jgi:hypothetical protein
MGRRSGASKMIDLIDFQSDGLSNVVDMETLDRERERNVIPCESS